jgi:hypothetical protein
MTLSRMSKFVLFVSPLPLTPTTGTYAHDQYPILDGVAAKVVAKYTSTPLRTVVAKEAKDRRNRLRYKNKRRFTF